MAMLDATTVNVALPALGNDLGASVADLQWTINPYTLAVASLVLLAGSLADRFGRRHWLVCGGVPPVRNGTHSSGTDPRPSLAGYRRRSAHSRQPGDSAVIVRPRRTASRGRGLVGPFRSRCRPRPGPGRLSGFGSVLTLDLPHQYSRSNLHSSHYCPACSRDQGTPPRTGLRYCGIPPSDHGARRLQLGAHRGRRARAHTRRFVGRGGRTHRARRFHHRGAAQSASSRTSEHLQIPPVHSR